MKNAVSDSNVFDPKNDVPLRAGSRLLYLILLLALVLRLIRLGTFPYWHDEVHNLVVSEHLEDAITTGEFISNHPPLPYVLLAGWRAMGLGLNEWTMRLLPALAGVAGVIATYACALSLFNRRTALLAAALVALSPFHVLHSQDLKEYIYLPFVATVMVMLFGKAVRRNAYVDWALYGVVAGVACYTEIFVGPLLAGINLWFVAMWREHLTRFKGWFLGNAIGAILFVPWLGIMMRKVDITMVQAEHWWIPPPSILGAAFYFKTIAFGYMAAKPWFYVATLLFAVLVVYGLLRGFGSRPATTLYVVSWAIVPVIIVYLISLYRESIFLNRAMLPYAMGMYVLAAMGLAALPKRAMRAALSAVVLLNAIGLGYYYVRAYPDLDFPHRPGTHPPRDYDTAAEYILKHWEEGDVVVHAAASTWMPFYWYGFRDRPHYFCGTSSAFINIINSGNPPNTRHPEFLGYFPREVQTAVDGRRRVWYVFSEWERKNLFGNPMDLWRWLDSHFVEIDHLEFRGIELLLYINGGESLAPLIISRDKDDGATATILRRSEEVVGSVKKTIPDSGLVARAPRERAGHLLLEFSPSPSSETHSQAQTTDTRAVTFSLTNRTAQPRRAIVDAMSSDALVEFASLYEDTPENDVWRIVPRFNYTPPPPDHEGAYQTATITSSESVAGVHGRVVLPAGAYDAHVYLAGVPGDVQRLIASGVSMRIGNTDLLSGLPRGDSSLHGYAWYRTPVVHVNTSGPASISLATTGAESQYPMYFAASYAALRRHRADPPPSTPVRHLPWPGEVTIAPNSTASWSLEVDRGIERVDVWAYELGEGGKAYRIFDTARGLR